MRVSIRLGWCAAVACLALGAMAQKPITYPAKNQSAQQQSRDDAQCAAWAQREPSSATFGRSPSTGSVAR